MVNKKNLIIAVLLAVVVCSIFATDVRFGKYVAGDSRNDLDHDYWILLNADGTASIHFPNGTANGTWRYDGSTISITIHSANGELADIKGQTLIFRHADGTGTVIYGEGDAFWLQ